MQSQTQDKVELSINKTDQETTKSVDKEKTSIVDFQTAYKELSSQDLSSVRDSILSDIKASQNMFQKIFTSFTTFPQHLFEGKITFLALAKVPFDEYKEVHVKMLKTIYKKLTEKYTTEVERYGNHWEEIGFQDRDPATDLRGVGMLGLLQLIALVTDYQKFAIKMWGHSNHEKYHFPLCLCGLNMTQIVKELLREGKLDSMILDENSVIKVCNDLYFAMFFRLFDEYKEGNYTIEHYPIAQQKLFEQVRSDPKKVIQDFRFKASLNFRYS